MPINSTPDFVPYVDEHTFARLFDELLTPQQQLEIGAQKKIPADTRLRRLLMAYANCYDANTTILAKHNLLEVELATLKAEMTAEIH